MAYQTGIAQNEYDLLDKLNRFLTTDSTLVGNGQAWTVLFDRTLPATPTQKDIRQIVWKSTGTGTEQTLYLGCESINSIADDTYNLQFFGGVFFVEEKISNSSIQPGMINCSPEVVLFADNRPIVYHFVADGRSCKVITRIANVCSTVYAGFILPTVPPTEYPYPFCVAGSSSRKKGLTYSSSALFPRYSYTNQYHSSIVDPRAGNCWLFTPDQTWRDFYGGQCETYSTDSNYQYLYPTCVERILGSRRAYIFQAMAASPGEHYPLLPVEFFSEGRSSQGENRWGCYDGVYWIPGVQRAVGDEVILPNGHKGLVCNAGFRTTTMDYFVIDLGEV
ncbi:hypothetical protein [Pasteurella multocida]|uniref:hypothetical protein n=1 Tax=Pasteurella multocida TaxID=747 RepID=UPI00292EA4E4|nr:hypothetical protein [Pasteurella multocida]WNY77335.1 hypothetical protein H2513_08850 [Pasteurella multocida]